MKRCTYTHLITFSIGYLITTVLTIAFQQNTVSGDAIFVMSSIQSTLGIIYAQPGIASRLIEMLANAEKGFSKSPIQEILKPRGSGSGQRKVYT